MIVVVVIVIKNCEKGRVTNPEMIQISLLPLIRVPAKSLAG